MAGYTLRKLSFQLINKISITYSEGLWEEWADYIFQRIATPDPLIRYLFINIGIMKIKRWNVVRFLQKKLTVLQFIHQDYFWLLVFKIN